MSHIAVTDPRYASGAQVQASHQYYCLKQRKKCSWTLTALPSSHINAKAASEPPQVTTVTSPHIPPLHRTLPVPGIPTPPPPTPPHPSSGPLLSGVWWATPSPGKAGLPPAPEPGCADGREAR